MELKRRLYTRGSSYETTIPKPLLFSLDLSKKQIVRFVYADEQHRWYIDFEEKGEESPVVGTAAPKKRKGGKR